MAKSPIIVVWASTTSNKENLDTTRQGNGIVFESDIVSNFVNSALYINSQATRNLQVMGGYYDGGQEYKNYQFCSQLSFIGGEYVLNYYMATQDNPTLAPTDATSYQQGTTDMEIPTNGSSVQSGWKKINLVPNQDNLVYKNKVNTFTESNTFNGNVTIGSDDADNCNIQATTTIPHLSDSTLKSGATLDTNNGVLKAGGVIFDKSKVPSGESLATNVYIVASTRGSNTNLSIQSDALILKSQNQRYTTKFSFGGATISDTNKGGIEIGVFVEGFGIKAEATSFFTTIRSPRILCSKQNNIEGIIMGFVGQRATMIFGNNTVNNKKVLYFDVNTTIVNAQFGNLTRGIDPVWEQDYATANYVNQKMQELFDYLDTRLTTIENKLGITSAKAKSRSGFDARAMINNIAVPKSKLAELLDRLDNLEGYEGVLGYSNDKERMELSKAIDNEEAIMQVMDSIKARMEKEAKEREAQDAQQNENPSPKTRKTKSKIKE